MLYKLKRPSLDDLARWAARLKRLDAAALAATSDDAAQRARLVDTERQQAGATAMPAAWRTRDRVRAPEWPSLDDLDLWKWLGASHALRLLTPSFSTIPQSGRPEPYAVAYATGYMTVMKGYMSEQAEDEPAVADAIAQTRTGIDPALARALVNAQGKAKSLAKDGTHEQRGYNYTTAEAITAEARRILNAEGLAWSRINSTLSAPSLAIADIGNQHYVGDVTVAWRLTYSVTGSFIEGASSIPIVVKMGTAHDKASKASETYGTGYILLGLLCLDRDGEHGVDHRREPESGGTDESGGVIRHDALRRAIDAKIDSYCNAFDMSKPRAWAEGLRLAGLPPDSGGDDGPWGDIPEAGLRAIISAYGKAMAT